MNYPDLLPLTSFLICAGISFLALFRRRWNPTALAFSLGMASLAFTEFINFLVLRAMSIEKMLLLKQLSLLGEMLFVGNFLLFSIFFAKEDIKTALQKWKWVIPPVYILPGILLVLSFTMHQITATGDLRIIQFGYIAKYFHILLLLIVVLNLVNLENTFRSSSGLERWKIKFMIFGVGSILSIYVYILSQRLLYNAIDVNNIYIMSAVIIVANLLISHSIIRNRIVDGDIYVSRKIIYSSFSLLAIGLYSIIIALSAQILASFNTYKDIKVGILLIFFAVLLLIIVFYKESFRRKAKAFINRNFKKSKYVYQDEWLLISTELSAKSSTEEICESFLNVLSERIFVKHASLWLIDEGQKRFSMVDSRNLGKRLLKIDLNDKIISYLFNKNHPISKSEIIGNKALSPVSPEIEILLDEMNTELFVPLIIGDTWVGLLTMGKIQTGEIYDEIEDYGLLKAAAAHAASAIKSARLFEEKMKSHELETFHRLSSFIMHDLKNTTSTLSMVAQNAEKHLNNPEFQKDALKTISHAVSKMEKMIGSLSDPPDRLSLQFCDADLNDLVNDAVDEFSADGFADLKIEKQFGRLPRIKADVEEIYKVVHNLLLNAYEASDRSGDSPVHVSTEANDDQVVFRVSDNGIGMQPEFIENSLFQQFKSTKKHGLGIGLYQCKTIVEAHGGLIKVESEPGKGSTFSVYLPIL